MVVLKDGKRAYVLPDEVASGYLSIIILQLFLPL
jgi:hypothetical protein